MMHYACCENWIELYQTKRREIEQEHALFHRHNERGTSSLLENLREENLAIRKAKGKYEE